MSEETKPTDESVEGREVERCWSCNALLSATDSPDWEQLYRGLDAHFPRVVLCSGIKNRGGDFFPAGTVLRVFDRNHSGALSLRDINSGWQITGVDPKVVRFVADDPYYDPSTDPNDTIG